MELLMPRPKTPIGTIAASAGGDGTWLAMNGQAVSQASYASLFKIIGHQPEFSWTQTTRFSGSNVIAQVAFGNSVYVAVGAGGVIYSSTDLVTWTSRTSGVATALNSVCWDTTNSLFVVVGASNVILTSPDGTTWTSRTSGVTSTLATVVSSGGRIVAVGSSGWITYSTDCVTWTATQPNSGVSLSYLVRRGTNWFTAPTSSAAGIVYSTDGTTWNYVAKPTTNNCNFIGFDATYFYLADGTSISSANGEIFRSTTGATWALVGTAPNNSSGNSGGPANACWTSAGVIAYAGNGMQNYTSNGFTTTGKLKFTPTIATFVSIISNPMGDSAQQFIFASFSTTGTAVYVTADGVNWMQDKLLTFFLPVGQTTKTIYANGKYFFPNALSVVYATAPYDITTQFQIPTRTDASGTALYIKAA